MYSSLSKQYFNAAALALIIALASFAALHGTIALAQNPQLEEKLMALRQKQAANKQKLAQYTWTETETISIKGEVKDTKIYQVQLGPNGQPQKTEVSNQQAQQGAVRDGLKSASSKRKRRSTRHTGSRSAPWPSNTQHPTPSV